MLSVHVAIQYYCVVLRAGLNGSPFQHKDQRFSETLFKLQEAALRCASNATSSGLGILPLHIGGCSSPELRLNLRPLLDLTCSLHCPRSRTCDYEIR